MAQIARLLPGCIRALQRFAIRFLKSSRPKIASAAMALRRRCTDCTDFSPSLYAREGAAPTSTTGKKKTDSPVIGEKSSQSLHHPINVLNHQNKIPARL